MSYEPSVEVLEKYAKVLVDFALGGGKGIKKGDFVYLQSPLSARILRNYHRFLWNVSLDILEQRTQVIPILLSRDPALREALQNSNYATVSQLLMGNCTRMFEAVTTNVMAITAGQGGFRGTRGIE